MSYRSAQSKRRYFSRPSAKHSSKKRQSKRETETTERLTGPSTQFPDIVSKTTNGLAHLGSQRFVLPPFADQFELWMRNLRFTLAEFEAAMGSNLDEAYKGDINKILNDLDAAFKERAANETKVSQIVAEMNSKIAKTGELLAKVDREHKANIRRLAQERASTKREAATLRRERSRLANLKTGFLARIFRRSEIENRETQTKHLDSKRAELARREERINKDESRARIEHELAKKKHMEELETQTGEFESLVNDASINDGVDLRAEACKRLEQQVVELTSRFTSREISAANTPLAERTRST